MKLTGFTRKSLAAVFVFTLLNTPSAFTYAQNNAPDLSPNQKDYFDGLYKDTWNCLASFIAPETGLPYDSTARQPVTSASNAGLYLASVAIASKTGLISREEGLKKTQDAFASLCGIKKWRGFPRPWFRVKNLEPAFGDVFSYGSHMANLIGGLVVAKNTFPELAEKIEAFLKGMAFKDLYDKNNGWLKGGYDMTLNNFAVYQPWGKWYYKFFASETRFLSFYGIARGAFPAAHWQALVRTTWQKGKYKLLASGYEEGGLFTYYAATLFLDERSGEMAEYQKNYTLAQLEYAKKTGAPVWGWSSCLTPKGRYLGFGELRDDIVAPYASVLAAIYFPVEVYNNLKTLEELGARKPFLLEGKQFFWGFRDSLDWDSGTVANDALTMDQAMIFLSLANLMHEGVVWKTFEVDSDIQTGLKRIHALDSQPSKAS